MSVHDVVGIVNVTGFVPKKMRKQFRKGMCSYDEIPTLAEKIKELNFRSPSVFFCYCCKNFYVEDVSRDI